MSSYVFQFFCGDGRGSFRPAQVQVQTRPKALTAQPHPPPHPSSAPRPTLPQQRPAESVGRHSSPERTRRRRRRSPSRSSSPRRAASPPPRATKITPFLRNVAGATKRWPTCSLCHKHSKLSSLLWPQIPHRPWPVCPRPELRPPRYAGPTPCLPSPHRASGICPAVCPRHAPACTSRQAAK